MAKAPTRTMEYFILTNVVFFELDMQKRVSSCEWEWMRE